MKFLYSQDLSNCTTRGGISNNRRVFLYSQDLSNCTTELKMTKNELGFCTLKI